MINGKQRAYLRGLANPQNAILNIGKTGVSPELVKAVDEALEARELVKIGLLDNCDVPAEDAARMVSERTRSEIVQIIGRKIVLYRKPKDEKKAVITLPKEKKKQA